MSNRWVPGLESTNLVKCVADVSSQEWSRWYTWLCCGDKRSYWPDITMSVGTSTMSCIDSIWLSTEPLDMRVGLDFYLARVVQVFGEEKTCTPTFLPSHYWWELFASRKSQWIFPTCWYGLPSQRTAEARAAFAVTPPEELYQKLDLAETTKVNVVQTQNTL